MSDGRPTLGRHSRGRSARSPNAPRVTLALRLEWSLRGAPIQQAVSEATPEHNPPQHGYEGLPWFDRVWVALLILVILTTTWRVIL